MPAPVCTIPLGTWIPLQLGAFQKLPSMIITALLKCPNVQVQRLISLNHTWCAGQWSMH